MILQELLQGLVRGRRQLQDLKGQHIWLMCQILKQVLQLLKVGREGLTIRDKR